MDRAISSGLTPIICLGETAIDKSKGRADDVLAEQALMSLGGLAENRVPDVILAYEPRWAIGATEAASPNYIAVRHEALRNTLRTHHGKNAADLTRIIYGGSVTPENGREIISIDNVDGLFVGRSAWKPEGFAKIIELVCQAANKKSPMTLSARKINRSTPENHSYDN